MTNFWWGAERVGARELHETWCSSSSESLRTLRTSLWFFPLSITKLSDLQFSLSPVLTWLWFWERWTLLSPPSSVFKKLVFVFVFFFQGTERYFHPLSYGMLLVLKLHVRSPHGSLASGTPAVHQHLSCWRAAKRPRRLSPLWKVCSAKDEDLWAYRKSCIQLQHRSVQLGLGFVQSLSGLAGSALGGVWFAASQGDRSGFLVAQTNTLLSQHRVVLAFCAIHLYKSGFILFLT